MADAKRCDICGKYYGFNYEATERPSLCGEYVDGMKIMSFDRQAMLGSYDLCENCANDLLAFIRQHKKEEAND